MDRIKKPEARGSTSDALLEIWDPMAADYNNKNFNSYVSGPGRSLSEKASGRKPNEYAKLRINNLPGHINEIGLARICQKVRPGVISAEVFRNRSNGRLWGLVKYATTREAQEVLTSLDKAPPLYLRIAFGYSIESKVNEESIQMHKENWRRLKQISEGAIVDASNFKPVSSMFLENNLEPETRQQLIDFSEDCFFNWEFQTGRGSVLPPRQPFLSSSLRPFGSFVEHHRAKMDLDPSGNRDQALDVFGHFAMGFFEETTSVMEMVYHKYRSKVGKGPRMIFGGRAYYMRQENESVKDQDGHYLDSFDALETVITGVDYVDREMVPGGLIGPKGALARCTICKEMTPTRCAGCYLPFCSASCARSQGGIHASEECKNLRNIVVHPIFQQKKAKVKRESSELGWKCNEPFENVVNIDTLTNVPASVLGLLCNRENTSADLVVQDVVHQFGEPQGFTCLIYNSEVKSWFRKLKNANSEETDLLVKVEPNLGVGELNLASHGGKLCRAVLREKVFPSSASCIFLDKGEVDTIPESELCALKPQHNSIPQLSLFATVTHYDIDFLGLWRKFIQPKKKLSLQQMELSKSGDEISAKLLSDNGDLLCSLLISKWLPMRPPHERQIPHTMPLKDGDRVVVSTFCSSNVCYVQRVGRQEQQCRLYSEIDMLNYYTAQCLPSLPQSGSLVAVKSSVDSKIYRAVVKTHTSQNTALVFFLDFGNREEVHKDQIYNLPASVAKMPAEAIIVRLSNVLEQPMSINAYMVWAQAVESKQQLEVKLDKDTNLTALISVSTNSSINNMINEALSKVQKEEQDINEQVVNENAYTLPSAPLPLEEGCLIELLVLHNFGDSLTCCPANSPLIRHVLDTQVRQAAKLVAECKEGSYAPKANEVCLAKFTDDLWYRAINIKTGKGWCDIIFIDIGNILRVPFTDMRKMPLNFNASPPMVTVANLAGFVKSELADMDIQDCIRTVLVPNSKTEGFVLKQNAGQAEIYFPLLVTKLEELGVVSKERITEMKKIVPIKQVVTDLLCDLEEPPKMEPVDWVSSAPMLNLLDSNLSYVLAPSLL